MKPPDLAKEAGVLFASRGGRLVGDGATIRKILPMSQHPRGEPVVTGGADGDIESEDPRQ